MATWVSQCNTPHGQSSGQGQADGLREAYETCQASAKLAQSRADWGQVPRTESQPLPELADSCPASSCIEGEDPHCCLSTGRRGPSLVP